MLTEVDIENLMRAKAAIYSGVAVLAESLDLSLDAIEEVVIAGGFGHYLDLERVTALGMVPEIAPERFVFLGNGSLAGAKLARRFAEVLRTAQAHGRDDHLPRAVGQRRLHGPVHLGAVLAAHQPVAVPPHRGAAASSASERRAVV